MKSYKLIICLVLTLIQFNTTNSQTVQCAAFITNPAYHAAEVVSPFLPKAERENENLMIRSHNGGSLITAKTVTNGINTDVQITKLNGCATVWSVIWNGPFNHDDWVNCVTTDEDGNIYLTGRTWNTTNNGWDLFVVGYDANGHYTWEDVYDGTGGTNDEGFSIIARKDMVYITGQTGYSVWNFAGITRAYHWPSHFNSWSTLFYGSYNARNKSICFGDDGQIYVASEAYDDFHLYESYIHTIQYDINNGNENWNMQYSLSTTPTYINYPMEIISDKDGVIVGGVGYEPGNGSDDYVLLKYDFGGGLTWSQSYDFSNLKDHLKNIVLDRVYNIVYATGCSEYRDDNQYLSTSVISTIALKATTGAYIWNDQFSSGPGMNDYGWDIELDCNSNVYVAGTDYYVLAVLSDYLLLKYTPGGTLAWSANYGNFASIGRGTDIAISGNGLHGGIYVLGETPISVDEWLIVGFRGIEECSARLAAESKENSLNQSAYPNPSKGEISYYSDYEGMVSIYDSQSRLIVQVPVSFGDNKLDLMKCENGIYYLVFHDSESKINRNEKIIINK